MNKANIYRQRVALLTPLRDIFPFGRVFPLICYFQVHGLKPVAMDRLCNDYNRILFWSFITFANDELKRSRVLYTLDLIASRAQVCTIGAISGI